MQRITMEYFSILWHEDLFLHIFCSKRNVLITSYGLHRLGALVNRNYPTNYWRLRLLRSRCQLIPCLVRTPASLCRVLFSSCIFARGLKQTFLFLSFYFYVSFLIYNFSIILHPSFSFSSLLSGDPFLHPSSPLHLQPNPPSFLFRKGLASHECQQNMAHQVEVRLSTCPLSTPY